MGTSRSRERITKPCDHCGKPVTRLKSQDAPRFYCDRTCYSSSARRAETSRANNAKRYPGGRVEVPCTRCGTTVSRAKSQAQGRAVFCSRECQYLFRREQGRKHVNSHGYIVVGVPADYPGAKRNGRYGQILEHRKVMQDAIGRPLMSDETVHHIDGDRQNNSLDNLELWSSSHPAGQRVVDKIAWAREFLARYERLDANDRQEGHPQRAAGRK